MLTVNECVCLLFTVSEWYTGMINLLTNNVATTKAIEPSYMEPYTICVPFHMLAE